MAIPREYLAYLATEMATRLGKSGKVAVARKELVAESIHHAIRENLAQEERLNQEVREHLERYSEQMRRDGISYQEMYKLVRKELLKKYRVIPWRGTDREAGSLSRDKLIELSHQIVKELATLKPEVQFKEASNEVRLEIVHQLQELLREEGQVEEAVRNKIRSQKREIAEGSAEWDILFRKYYTEEMRKLGVE
ncbi:MAG: DUF507 family protein [Acidobacteria bacterium]|nr:DUF507 family protein [Acidobacteriota bacterium]